MGSAAECLQGGDAKRKAPGSSISPRFAKRNHPCLVVMSSSSECLLMSKEAARKFRSAQRAAIFPLAPKTSSVVRHLCFWEPCAKKARISSKCSSALNLNKQAVSIECDGIAKNILPHHFVESVFLHIN